MLYTIRFFERFYETFVLSYLYMKPLFNNLKYPPIKQTPLPEVLIWHCKKFPKYHDFIMFTTKGQFYYSKMVCTKSNYVINEQPKPSLFIYFLKSSPNKKGLGTKMLNFATKLSSRIGCEGRFHLYADPSLTPQQVPHIFYRKFGMTTNEPKTDKKLDLFIKKNKAATYKDFQKEFMFFNPNNKNIPQKLSFWDKLKKIL